MENPKPNFNPSIEIIEVFRKYLTLDLIQGTIGFKTSTDSEGHGEEISSLCLNVRTLYKNSYRKNGGKEDAVTNDMALAGLSLINKIEKIEDISDKEKSILQAIAVASVSCLPTNGDGTLKDMSKED